MFLKIADRSLKTFAVYCTFQPYDPNKAPEGPKMFFWTVAVAYLYGAQSHFLASNEINELLKVYCWEIFTIELWKDPLLRFLSTFFFIRTYKTYLKSKIWDHKKFDSKNISSVKQVILMFTFFQISLCGHFLYHSQLVGCLLHLIFLRYTHHA